MDMNLNTAGSGLRFPASALPLFYATRRPERLDVERLVWDVEYREKMRPLWRKLDQPAKR